MSEYEVIAEIQPGFIIAWVSLESVKEQDKNALIMNPVMFNQLADNIKKRGALESLPFCALVDGVVEIVSGHHRIRAARAAGITRIPTLIDTTGLSRSAIAAKQLAHNFLVGFSDKDMTAEIAKMITDVDDMIESYLEKSQIEVRNIDVGALLNPTMDIDWKEVSFLFLTAQFDRFKELISALGKKDMIGAAGIESFKPFIDALGKYQKYSDIHSVGMAIDLLTKKALEEVTGAGYEEDGEWQSIASCIGGGGSIPKAQASILKNAIDEMVKAGIVDKKQRWQGLLKMADYYLKRGEAG